MIVGRLHVDSTFSKRYKHNLFYFNSYTESTIDIWRRITHSLCMVKISLYNLIYVMLYINIEDEKTIPYYILYITIIVSLLGIAITIKIFKLPNISIIAKRPI